jgi:KUP system potassium uptake protein
MLFATIGLVLAFGSSERLAAAYGIAISLAMVIDSVLVIAWLSQREQRRERVMLAIMSIALTLDLGFLAANSLKIPHGGWLPLLAGAMFLMVMMTWQSGRLLVSGRVARRQMSLRQLLAKVESESRPRSPGTGVFLNRNAGAVPGALQRMLEVQGSLHERVVMLTLETSDEPRSRKGNRVQVKELAPGLFRVVARCGFMELPNVPTLLREAERCGLPFLPAETQYFLGRDHVVVARSAGMSIWRKRLYAFMTRNAYFAAEQFSLPPGRVTEIGEQIEI